MSHTITLVSDLDHEKGFLTSIKRREIEQKFIYLGENAHEYYHSTHMNKVATTGYWDNMLTAEKATKFIANLVKEDAKKVALVSLGCGNAKVEAELLMNLGNSEKYTFIGVDSSKEMLQLAEDMFNQKNLEGLFFCADFSSEEFNNEIKTKLQKDKYDQVIFLLVGSTLGNVSQTEIVDTLYNVLNKGDVLYLDIMTRPSLDKQDDLMIFKSYSQLLNNVERIRFYANPVISLGIPEDNMKITLKAVSESSIGVLCFQYAVEILKATLIEYRGERIHLLPPEEIKFLEIRTYHTETMISYFLMHNLLLLDHELSGYHGQFAFYKE